MNFVFVTDGSGSTYSTDYVSTLASTLRAEGHTITLFIRKGDSAEAFASFEPQKLGSGRAIDVMSPVRLSGALRHIDGRTIVQVFTPSDARLALNAVKLADRQSDVRVVLTLLDSHRLPAFKDWEKQVMAAVDAVTVDTPEAVASIPGAKFIAPGMPDRRVSETTPPPDGLGLLYIGKLVKGCTLPDSLKVLEDFTDRSWTLEVCGTGRGAFIMGPVRRTRAAGINDNITWQGNDFNPMEALARSSVLIGEDSPYNRLMADCAGRPLLVSPSADDIADMLAHPEKIAEKSRQARDRYVQGGTFSRFYNEIMAVYK